MRDAVTKGDLHRQIGTVWVNRPQGCVKPVFVAAAAEKEDARAIRIKKDMIKPRPATGEAFIPAFPDNLGDGEDKPRAAILQVKEI